MGTLSERRRARGRGLRRTVRLAKRPANGERVYQPGETGEELGEGSAATDWGTIARIYDLEHPACRGAELRFWHELAASMGGTALELATGSGRIALALARKGHRVTGLELSEGMLERAQRRRDRLPPVVQERLTFVQGDMVSFDLHGTRAYPPEGFGLIFVAYNSFWLLPTLDQQARCLECVQRHLAPNGRFVLDLFPPNQDDYQDEPGIAQLLPTPLRGKTLVRVKDYTYDPATRLATSDVRYYAAERGEAQPVEVVAQFRYALRIAAPEEVQALLESHGFAIEATYGTYDKDPLEPNSPRAVFVARRHSASGAT